MVDDRGDGLLAAVHRLVDERLYPAATDVDRGRRHFSEHLPALAELGLFAMSVPEAADGLELSAARTRAVLRALGSGCGVTAFAFAQHLRTAAMTATTDNGPLRDRWLEPLRSGTLSGIAYAHLRRPGPPALRATADGDGWRLDGMAPWVTSWGTAAAFMVAAVDEQGRMVWSIVPGREAPGLRVATEFELMVFQHTDTVALAFDGYRLEADQVLEVIDVDRWRVSDRPVAARPNPLCLGVGDRALAELAAIEPAVAAELGPWWQDVCARAETHSVAVDRREAVIAEVAASRAETLDAVQRLTTALLAATGGRAVEAANPAQRLSREALFYVIQAQNEDGRAATLARVAGG